jgi:hypothetical protein
VAPLLSEARQNEVAAYAKNRERDMHVAGVVLQTGIGDFRRIVAHGTAWMGLGSANAREVLVHYPYMIVGDDRAPSGDVVKCYFSTEEADIVGKLQPGMKVTFQGRFHQYVYDQGRLVLTLSSCSLD